MTLQASGSISLTDVLNEIKIANPGRALPISLGDSDVLSLAGKSSPPISLSDLYGKSSFTATGVNDSASINTYNAPSSTIRVYPSVNVIGGSNPTYQWTMTSYTGLTPTLSNTTSQSCMLSHPYSTNSNGAFDAVLQCVVTNGNGAQITVTGITGHADWSNGSL